MVPRPLVKRCSVTMHGNKPVGLQIVPCSRAGDCSYPAQPPLSSALMSVALGHPQPLPYLGADCLRLGKRAVVGRLEPPTGAQV